MRRIPVRLLLVARAAPLAILALTALATSVQGCLGKNNDSASNESNVSGSRPCLGHGYGYGGNCGGDYGGGYDYGGYDYGGDDYGGGYGGSSSGYP
jgi:hypothetical protein